MSRVLYDGNRIIPAPLVTVTKNYQSSGAGEKIGTEWSITITGTLVAWMGSPNSTGTFWTSGGFPPDENITENSRLAAVIRKGEALRRLFATDGKEMEWQSEDGSQPMKCNPKVLSVSLAEGTWFDRLNYTIVLTASVLSVNGLDVGEDNYEAYIESADESWQMETNEEPESFNRPRTYKLSHVVTAKGKRVFNSDGSLLSEAYIQAQDWVTPRLGFSSSIVTGSAVIDASSTTGRYNYIRSESIDKQAGSYSVTETWILANSAALETYSISLQNSIDNANTKVTIDGNITGLETRDDNLTLVVKKFDNAKALFNTIEPLILSRASTYAANINSSLSLNPNPVSQQVTQSVVAGVITYNYEFDDRPTNLISDARLESIVVTNTLPTDYCVPIFVLGRAQGPVLQNLNTSKETTRSVNVELVMDKTDFGTFTFDNSPKDLVEAIVDTIKPVGTTVLVQDNNDSWDIKSGRYTYTITWIWET